MLEQVKHGQEIVFHTETVLYKSTDGGSNWKKLGFDKSERIANIIVNPKNSNEVYVAVLGALWSDSDERGVYKSSDAGENLGKDIVYR